MKQITFLFLLFSLYMSSQNIEVTYKQLYKNKNNFSKSEPQLLNTNYSLKISDGKTAIFRINNKLNTDNDSSNYIEQLALSVGKNLVYYKDLIKKEKIVFVSMFGRKISVYETFKTYNWVLLNEKKKIGDYICYKAICTESKAHPITKEVMKEVITVWYAPQINLPFGPSGYDGLPGLVLESYADSFYFVATKINLKKKNIIIVKPNSDEVMSKKEYESLIDDIINNR